MPASASLRETCFLLRCDAASEDTTQVRALWTVSGHLPDQEKEGEYFWPICFSINNLSSPPYINTINTPFPHPGRADLRGLRPLAQEARPQKDLDFSPTLEKIPIYREPALKL